MKAKIKYVFFLVLCITVFNTCNDDKTSVTDEEQREFMALFRWAGTNGGNDDDPRNCKVVNNNDMYLSWNGINDCAGYRLQWKLRSGNWDRPEDLLGDIVLPPDSLHIVIEDLQYDTPHQFAIQTLSKKGEAYHSYWYGKGSNDDQAEWAMNPRPGIPYVISVRDVTYTTMRIYFELDIWNRDENGNPTTLRTENETFEYDSNGKFIVNQISVVPAAVGIADERPPSKFFDLTNADRERGYIDVDGLVTNVMYVVNAHNNSPERYWDRLYNTVMKRMKGDVGEPVVIPHELYEAQPNSEGVITVNELNIERWSMEMNAAPIHNFLRDEHMDNNDVAEGTIYVLEAGKTYFIQRSVDIYKGLVLKGADPNNRSKVLMGLGYNDRNGGNAWNWSFGRSPKSGEIGGIDIQSIVFENIDFEAYNSYNCFNIPELEDCCDGQGNYFVNQSSNVMDFECESFEVRNCTFKGMIRGFIRFQGNQTKTLHKLIFEDCLIYQCGAYSQDGRGYSFFRAAGGANNRSNVFKDVQLRRCSFIDSPMNNLFEEGQNNAWESPWSFLVENCTFLNFSTKSTNRYLFAIRYAPINSSYTFRNNLFILTKHPDDIHRPLHMSGAEIEAANLTGATVDFHDNYSTQAFLTGNANEGRGQIFSSNGFTSTGRYGFADGNPSGSLNRLGMEELYIKLGDVGITPEELMVDPYPLYYDTQDYSIALPDWRMHWHNMEGLYYRNTDKVKNHEIFRKNIGDPRWRKNVTP